MPLFAALAVTAIVGAGCSGSQPSSSAQRTTASPAASVMREASLTRGVMLCIKNDARREVTITHRSNTDGGDYEGQTVAPGAQQCTTTSGESGMANPNVTVWMELPGGIETPITGANPTPGWPYVGLTPRLSTNKPYDLPAYELSEGETKYAQWDYNVGAINYVIPVIIHRAEDSYLFKNLEVTIRR